MFSFPTLCIEIFVHLIDIKIISTPKIRNNFYCPYKVIALNQFASFIVSVLYIDSWLLLCGTLCIVIALLRFKKR